MRFKQLLAVGKLDELVSRYPLRETRAFGLIAVEIPADGMAIVLRAKELANTGLAMAALRLNATH